MKKLFFVLVAFLGLPAAGMYAQDVTAAKNAIKAAYEALSRKDWPAFAARCATSYTDLNVGPQPTSGIDASIELYKQFAVAFPDFSVQPSEIVPAGGNRYFVHLTVSGTNTGSMMGMPATGKTMKFEDTDIVELDNAGKCIRHSVGRPGEPLRQIGYGSMLNPSVQVVMAAYEKFSKGDVAGLLALCSDNAVFEIQDRMFDSKARVFPGKAGIGQFFQELGSKFRYSKFLPTRFVADGDDVFILIDAEYTLQATGVVYASTYTHHFKVSNGKIDYFRGVDDFQSTK